MGTCDLTFPTDSGFIRAAGCLWLDGEKQKEHSYVQLRKAKITSAKYRSISNLLQIKNELSVPLRCLLSFSWYSVVVYDSSYFALLS